MSSTWSNIAFPEASCMESYYVAKDIKSNKRNGTKTQSKLVSTGAISEQKN